MNGYQSGRMPSEWCVFTEMVRVGRTAYIRGVTFITPLAVAVICGPSRLIRNVLYKSS